MEIIYTFFLSLWLHLAVILFLIIIFAGLLFVPFMIIDMVCMVCAGEALLQQWATRRVKSWALNLKERLK